MPTDRRYCRFSRSMSAPDVGMGQVPEDGLCLCAFLVISSRERPGHVLLGKLDPTAPWDHLGALDPGRLEAWKDRWMLPSSHLMLHEAPAEAAERILAEQTGLSARPLPGPQVASEVYAPQRHPHAQRHWDLEFIFQGEAREDELRPHPAWRELRFLETRSIVPDAMARAQEDILRYAGFPLA